MGGFILVSWVAVQQSLRKRGNRDHCGLPERLHHSGAFSYRRKIASAGKKYATSTLAVSGASDPWTAFASIDFAKSARIVPGAAFFGSVAPIRSRFLAIAFSPSSTWIITGPEIMNSTRS